MVFIHRQDAARASSQAMKSISGSGQTFLAEPEPELGAKARVSVHNIENRHIAYRFGRTTATKDSITIALNDHRYPRFKFPIILIVHHHLPVPIIA